MEQRILNEMVLSNVYFPWSIHGEKSQANVSLSWELNPWYWI